MATVWFATPHIPLIETPSNQYDGLGLTTNQRLYFEAITEMDRQIGRIRAELDRLGVADDTMLVFNSDNGPQSLSFGSAGGLRGAKRSLYEGGIRTPAVVEWPSRVAAGSSSLAPITTSDFFPTLLDVWGVESVDGRPLDGDSFLDVLDDPTTGRGEDYRFFSTQDSRRMVMDERHKLVSNNGGATFEMFDLVSDPRETDNLLVSNQPIPASITEKRDELAAALNAWIAESASSAAGNDAAARVAAIENATLAVDFEATLPMPRVGTDAVGGEVFEDRYRLEEGFHEDDTSVLVITEKQYSTLAEGIAVLDAAAEPQTIAAGEVVHSFLLHFDPSTEASVTQFTAEVRFDDAILGIIADPSGLDATDTLAFAEPGFPTGSSARGIEDSPQEGWEVGPDGKTLIVQLSSLGDDIDQLRVITAGSIELAGDYNNDGVVDAADYTVWRDGVGVASEPFRGGDGDGDGVTDAADYEVWLRYFGNAPLGDLAALSDATTVSTPSPSAGVLCVVAAAAAAARPARRRSVVVGRV